MSVYLKKVDSVPQRTKGRAKLNESDVFEMRVKRNKGVSFQKIANEYGVHKKTVKDAVRGKHWSDVAMPELPKDE